VIHRQEVKTDARNVRCGCFPAVHDRATEVVAFGIWQHRSPDCARGSRVETIFPDGSSERLFGVDALDLSLRRRAARAGYDQGRALAQQLTEFGR
jgi:hypothetical protein